MALRIGATVIDRATGATAEIRHIVRVPPQQDLCGRRIPGHRRFTLVYPDGRWSDIRTDKDLAPVE